MKFTRNKKDNLSVLRTDEGKALAATGTVDDLLKAGALLAAPRGVSGDKWLILQIAGGKEQQFGNVYDDKASAKAAMLKMAERGFYGI